MKILTNTYSDIFLGRKSKLRKQNVPTSYTRIGQNFIQVLKAVGLKWKEYGLHSL